MTQNQPTNPQTHMLKRIIWVGLGWCLQPTDPYIMWVGLGQCILTHQLVNPKPDPIVKPINKPNTFHNQQMIESNHPLFQEHYFILNTKNTTR